MLNIVSQMPILYNKKALRAGSHWVGEELCRQSDPPQEDFHAARLTVGNEVYAVTDENLLYVKTGEERFERFVPETDENVQDYDSQN